MDAKHYATLPVKGEGAEKLEKRGWGSRHVNATARSLNEFGDVETCTEPTSRAGHHNRLHIRSALCLPGCVEEAGQYCRIWKEEVTSMQLWSDGVKSGGCKQHRPTM
jgi:hypothetical protein